MAAELGVTSVMSPTHILRPGVDNIWLPIDCRSVALLRAALDREAGRHVAIVYPLILPHTRLLDDQYMPRILAALHGLPVDNLVLRLSGFGADAGPLTVKRTLGAIQQLHVLGYPILLDYVGGLVGLGALAFGIVSGIAHGIGERDRFKALSDWRKRIDSMTRMFETLSERTLSSPPPMKRRQGPGALTNRSSA